MDTAWRVSRECCLRAALVTPARSLSGLSFRRVCLTKVCVGRQARRLVTLDLCEKSAAIRVNGSIRLWTGLIDGQYPQYEGIIPSEFVGNVSVPKGALCSAVSRATALSKGRRLAGVALEMDGSSLVMRLGEDAGDGISSIERVSPARAEGTVPLCGLRISYLSTRLRVCPTCRGWISSLRTTRANAGCDPRGGNLRRRIAGDDHALQGLIVVFSGASPSSLFGVDRGESPCRSAPRYEGADDGRRYLCRLRLRQS